MKRVMQTCADPDRGDCQRAAIASLFDLEIEQVPHFRIYPEDTWFSVFHHFLLGIGWEYCGCQEPMRDVLADAPTVDGYIYASVRSRTFPGKTHAVLVDRQGVVHHDPNPNQAFVGVNVLESQELSHWYLLEPLKDERLADQ